jgi:hypothetical protein
MKDYHTLALSSQSPTEEVEIYKIDSPEAIAIHKKIAQFLYKDLQPLCVVVDIRFVELLQHLCPKYNIPSRTFFANNILPKEYQVLKVQFDLPFMLTNILNNNLHVVGWVY